MYRTIVYIGFLGSAYCLFGCDAIPAGGDAELLGESPAVTGKFFAAATDEFATARAVTVEADSVTVMPRTVLVPNDLWENEPEKAALVLDASAIIVTVTGESNKRAHLTARGTERHAMMIVHIAPPDHEPCGSESVVGPFDMTIADGVVMLTNVSQPLDAAARSAVRNGRFEICAETWADFDGVISIENAAFEFGTMPDNEERVEVCHIPPGNPGNGHTITIAASAVPAHLAHGDYLGECEGPDDDATDDDGDDSGDQDDGQTADIDNDGIRDAADLCAATPEGETANAEGCSCSQRDADADGVNDCDDACPDSQPGTAVINTGCAEENPSDDDGDGVHNDIDLCPDTAPDATVDDVGCTCSQLGNCDSDGDGVLDAADTCPDTPEGELPNDQGCSCSQIAPCDDGDVCTTDACKAGACIFAPVLCEGGVCVDGTCNCITCSVEYPYVVIGNDGHSFYLDGEYINGAGFGTDLTGTLTLEAGEHTLEVLLYNSVGGGAILFGHKENGAWKVPSEYPRIALRADDGTANAWSVYRALDCGYHSPYSFIPNLGDWEATFWMTVPERGAGLWNTNDATTDHWIIWDDYGSTVVLPQSYWVCRTTVIVSE